VGFRGFDWTVPTVARTPSDRWWRCPDCGAFFITIGGKLHNLGPDEQATRIQVARLKLLSLERANEKPPPPSVCHAGHACSAPPAYLLRVQQRHREPFE